MSQHTYSNPRTMAIIENWPSGQHRVTAFFNIEEHGKRGQRATRCTTDPRTGRMNKPKLTTYADIARIVDSDDGRTYVLELVKGGSHLHVWQSDMQHGEEVIFPDNPRYPELLALLQAEL